MGLERFGVGTMESDSQDVRSSSASEERERFKERERERKKGQPR